MTVRDTHDKENVPGTQSDHNQGDDRKLEIAPTADHPYACSQDMSEGLVKEHIKIKEQLRKVRNQRKC